MNNCNILQINSEPGYYIQQLPLQKTLNYAEYMKFINK